jgi:hypothetical protein
MPRCQSDQPLPPSPCGWPRRSRQLYRLRLIPSFGLANVASPFLATAQPAWLACRRPTGCQPRRAAPNCAPASAALEAAFCFRSSARVLAWSVFAAASALSTNASSASPQTPTRSDAKKASPLAWKSSSGAVQIPPAHNAYATTPQPANPVRHAAIHASMISSQTDLHARQSNTVRICLA